MSAPDVSGHLVQLSGPITLYESNELRETLLLALSEGEDFAVDLETSGPWDLAGLQLLIALIASGRKLDRRVRLVHVPRVCLEIAERSGLDDWLRTVTDSFC
jgi:anti-anti-sigma regulatory factor